MKSEKSAKSEVMSAISINFLLNPSQHRPPPHSHLILDFDRGIDIVKSWIMLHIKNLYIGEEGEGLLLLLLLFWWFT